MPGNYGFEQTLIDCVTQHDFVDTNFGQSCSKIEIWFMFNCQTKRTIVALFIYPEIPPCRVFFWARWSNICLSTRLRNPAQFPLNRRFLPHNLPPKTRIFFFFPHPVRRPVLSVECFGHILRKSVKSTYPINLLKVDTFYKKSKARFSLKKICKQLTPPEEIMLPLETASQWHQLQWVRISREKCCSCEEHLGFLQRQIHIPSPPQKLQLTRPASCWLSSSRLTILWYYVSLVSNSPSSVSSDSDYEPPW